jgi:penicillin-binding protein 1A
VAQRKTRTRHSAETGKAPEIEIDPADRPSAPPRPKRDAASRKAKSRRKKSAKRGWRSIALRTGYWGVVAVLWIGIAGIGTLVWVGAHLPPLQSLEVPKRPPTIQIVDIAGKPLATRGDMGGAIIPLKELPPYLPKAFLAIEDRRFYAHVGVDPIGLLRASAANILHRGYSQGGSTITQQLAKNLFLTPERTLNRKLQEAALALWLERKFTKDQILELYLNRVYFGAGAYGIEAAAQRYFGKSARQVTLAESALLAGLVKSPSKLAPTHDFNAAQKRAQIVLAAMADAHFIRSADVKMAMSLPPRIVNQVAGGTANYVADFVRDALNELVGHIDTDVTVETTVDADLQSAAEKSLTEELAAKGAKFDAEQGALIAMMPDGAIRALVGGKNYAESQFNRAVAAKRQPGSAFKPFVYLTALERGLTPDTVRDDKPISVKGWRPENYTRQYFGPVTLTRALANSLNTVSVRLTLEFGPTAVTRTAYRLGISSKLEPNASIALGTSEVTPLELVSAYVPFANGGMAITPHIIERVRTSDGKVLYARHNEALGRIIEPVYVDMMNHMLRETVVSGTARKAEMPGWGPAGKTGTSQDFRDAWFVGYTSHMIAGVWIGNDDSSPMHKATGSGLPVDIWSRFMKIAHQGVPVAALPVSNFTPRPLVARGDIHGLAQAVSSNPPPANPASASLVPPRQRSGNALDNWSIDQLFSRR